MSFPVGRPSSTDAGFLHAQRRTFTRAATRPSPGFLVLNDTAPDPGGCC